MLFLTDGVPQRMLGGKVVLLPFLQNVSFTEENGDAMSFDECLQLLAETFPVEETEVRTLNYYYYLILLNYHSLKPLT